MTFVGFILGVLFVVIGFWLDGYDFDARGEKAVLLYVMSLCVGIITSMIAKIIDEHY